MTGEHAAVGQPSAVPHFVAAATAAKNTVLARRRQEQIELKALSDGLCAVGEGPQRDQLLQDLSVDRGSAFGSHGDFRAVPSTVPLLQQIHAVSPQELDDRVKEKHCKKDRCSGPEAMWASCTMLSLRLQCLEYRGRSVLRPSDVSAREMQKHTPCLHLSFGKHLRSGKLICLNGM